MRVPGWLYGPIMWLSEPWRSIAITIILMVAAGCLVLVKFYLLTGAWGYLFAAGMLACVWLAALVSWLLRPHRRDAH